MRGIGAIVFCGFTAFMTFHVIPQFQAVHNAIHDSETSPPQPVPSTTVAGPEWENDRALFRPLAQRALELAPYCYGRKANEDRPLVRGKALVWDVATDNFSPVHCQLPPDLRATNVHEECTAFVVLKQEQKKLSREYFESAGLFGVRPKEQGIPAYRIDSEVAVVTLPAGTPRGYFLVQGAVPPGMVKLETELREVIGSSTTELARFVETSMKGTGPQRSIPYLEKFRLLVDQARPALFAGTHGSPVPKNVTAKALVWDAQRNVPHPANLQVLPIHSYLPEDGSQCLVVFVTNEHLVPNSTGGGRYDLAVNLVQLPGPVALGAFTIRGEEWPSPREVGQSWKERNLHDPLRFWVDKLYAKPEPKTTARAAPLSAAPSPRKSPWGKTNSREAARGR